VTVPAALEDVRASAYTIPTDGPEADGTLAWDSTTLVLVEASAGGRTGLGFTYGPSACAALVGDLLRDAVLGRDALDVPGAWSAMVKEIRNAGRPGICSMAIAAADLGLWDLKARLLDVPLVALLGKTRDHVPLYGSGGFTTYPDARLAEQVGAWVHDDGIPRVKIKIGQDWGTDEERDLERTALARKVIGDGAELFVDANGAYSRKQAARMARRLGEFGVTWFEEPVSSDDLDGLREIRDLTDIDVAAGEYGYDLVYFERMCAAGAVDCLQIDVTRCGGITEFVRAAAVAAAHGLEVSGHTAPSMHAHVACAVPNLRHLEYFHDHVRIERLLFDGVLDPEYGSLTPDLTVPGHGLTFKQRDAERFRKD